MIASAWPSAIEQEAFYQCRASQRDTKIPLMSQAPIDTTQGLIPLLHGNHILNMAQSVPINIHRRQP